MKIFIPENNLGNEGSHLWNMIKKMPDVRCYWQKNDRPGIHKGKDTADDYQCLFNVKLERGAVRFDSQFFTTSKGHNVNTMKGLAQGQLERFRYDYEEAKTVHGNPKMTITGKTGTSEQDDGAIAILMGAYWGRYATKDMSRLRDD
jgi:hypothetical protein